MQMIAPAFPSHSLLHLFSLPLLFSFYVDAPRNSLKRKESDKSDGYNKLHGVAGASQTTTGMPPPLLEAATLQRQRAASGDSYNAGYNKLHAGADAAGPGPDQDQDDSPAQSGVYEPGRSNTGRRSQARKTSLTGSAASNSEFTAGYSHLQAQSASDGKTTLRRETRANSGASEYSAGYNQLHGAESEGNTIRRTDSKSSEYSAGYTKLHAVGHEDSSASAASASVWRDQRSGSGGSEFTAGYSKLQGVESDASNKREAASSSQRQRAHGADADYTDGYNHLDPDEEVSAPAALSIAPSTLRRGERQRGSGKASEYSDGYHHLAGTDDSDDNTITASSANRSSTKKKGPVFEEVVVRPDLGIVLPGHADPVASGLQRRPTVFDRPQAATEDDGSSAYTVMAPADDADLGRRDTGELSAKKEQLFCIFLCARLTGVSLCFSLRYLFFFFFLRSPMHVSAHRSLCQCGIAVTVEECGRRQVRRQPRQAKSCALKEHPTMPKPTTMRLLTLILMWM